MLNLELVKKQRMLSSLRYNSGLVTIGEWSVIPDNVKVGKNTAISGETTLQDYPNGELPGGGIIIKAGDN